MTKHFKQNFMGKSTYTCRICNHLTRETGEGEQDVLLCAPCFELCGYENMISDGDIAHVRKDIVEDLIEYIEKRGYGDAGWRDIFVKVLQ